MTDDDKMAGYGLGAVHFVRYLVPTGEKTKYRELFVGPVDQLKVGESRTVKSPSGDTYVMARTPDGFRILSDICPHLGCRVHWKPDKEIFHCPCHDGVFDAEGTPSAARRRRPTRSSSSFRRSSAAGVSSC